MNNSTNHIQPEETPVDDVRRVREEIVREAGNDIRTLVEQTNAATKELMKKLNIRIIPPPSNNPQKTKVS